MKTVVTILLLALSTANANSQFLKKLKDKAQQTINRSTDKAIDNVASAGNTEKEDKTAKGSDDDSKTATPASNLKVYSKFDFVPGTTILYFDNFENDNIGESPAGWITSTSAETVTIEGLEGNWLKLASTSSSHISRSKKQSWGNNFTIEFDLLMVKNTYDPRIDILLLNTGGNLVTDEGILKTGKPVLTFSGILAEGNKSRASLYAGDRKLSDNMTETLAYSNSTPVHISMCVQAKRFRMWWNDRKLYDLAAISEEYLPNQLGFSFGHVGGSEFFVSNIRISKDVPDTRAKFTEGKLVSNLLFYTGTAKLKPESMGSLLDVSKMLKEATSPVKIVGYTDSDGDEAANVKLSQQRAEAVKEILIQEYSIEADKLTTEGRGEAQPLADNNTTEGKAQNRRVEFIFKAEADKYVSPSSPAANNVKPAANNGKTAAAGAAGKPGNASTGGTMVKMQSKILNVSLPYAQFMKTADNRYTFIASKEEGNSKENYFKIMLISVNPLLKPETYNFDEINKTNALYGTKKYAEISGNEAVLYYGAGQKPYVYKFSPIIANGTMASYVDESLARHLPAASPNCKFVIEKVEDGKASGYFTVGIMIQGLKPVTKGDAMQDTFTDGFSGELKCTFSNVPVY